MSENLLAAFRPELSLTDFPPLPHKSESESSTVSQEPHAWTPKPSGGPRKQEGEDAARSDKVRRLRREAGNLKERLERQEAEIVRLRKEEEKLVAKCKRRDDRIAKVDRESGQMRRSFQEDAQKRTKEIQALEERLKKTNELIATRTKLSEEHTSLTTDCISGAEMLSIVRDLNEHIYQVAVSLTEELEKLESPPAAIRLDVDPTSRPHIPTLVQLARNQDFTGLTFLLQSCLCFQAVRMTLSWGRHRELAMLESIYQRLSASGKRRVTDLS